MPESLTEENAFTFILNKKKNLPIIQWNCKQKKGTPAVLYVLREMKSLQYKALICILKDYIKARYLHALKMSLLHSKIGICILLHLFLNLTKYKIPHQHNPGELQFVNPESCNCLS